ncbi:hypothetical protein BC835DRAFT_485680 [Cytidiella melzeri]|nr:hypothetical protein BC835DRAFT_485680 [Cytidiella melzeri]
MFCKHTHRVRHFTDHSILAIPNADHSAPVDNRSDAGTEESESDTDASHSATDTRTSYKLQTKALRTIVKFICKRGSEHIFPQLVTSSTVSPLLGWVAKYIPYLCGPTLRTLKIRVVDSSRRPDNQVYGRMSKALNQCSFIWPHLHHVELPFYFDANYPGLESYLQSLDTFIKPYPKLEALEACLPAQGSLFQHNSELPQLHTLDLMSIHYPPSQPGPHQLSRSCFKSLKHLKLKFLSCQFRKSYEARRLSAASSLS